MEARFTGGFMDGEIREIESPPPTRLELWPENETQRAKRDATKHLCTSQDSQVYEMISLAGEGVVYRPIKS